MDTPGVYRELDALMRQYSPPNVLDTSYLSGPSLQQPGASSPNPVSPLRSPPRVPELHVRPPGEYLAPLPPEHAGVPSLAANVPFYHVPGPCADNRRNLRLAVPTTHHLHQTGAAAGPALHSARLFKRPPRLLCLPCGGAQSWTLRLTRSPARSHPELRARCVVALLLFAALVLATATALVMLASVLGVEPALSNWGRGWSVENDSGPPGGAVVSGEFVLSRERFTADLSDQDSAPFHTLASQLVVQLDVLFEASELRDEYNSSAVTALHAHTPDPGVVVQCRLLLLAPALEDEGEPANRAGLAFLRGLVHREGRMWLGHFEVDVQTISFSARRSTSTVDDATVEHLEAGWSSWGTWSACGPGGMRSRSRHCALRGGEGKTLPSIEKCLVHGGGDLQLRDCSEKGRGADQRENRLPALLAVRDLSQNIEIVRAPAVPLRLCDECAAEEICVALLGESVPSCRTPKDRTDPTGCGGLCRINTELCHQLDTDAFRCMDDSRCLETEWRCGNQLCIPRVKRCDGHMNCYDHTDEYNCGCNVLTHFHCGNRTSCLSLSKRCDGVIDCWDASDEINCTAACPSPAHFTCSNGECIPHSKFCDGFSDCKDKSDEPFGCGGECKASEFRCRNGRCIRRHTICDSFDTCGDGSDEESCSDPRKPDKLALAHIAATERALLLGCRDGQFRCASGDCIRQSLVCDGVDDCGDWSDEHACPP